MKKRIIYFIVLFFTFVLGIYNVSARACLYGNSLALNFKETEEGSGIFTVDYYVSNSEYYTDIYNFVDPSFITSDDQCLKSIYTCVMSIKDGYDWTDFVVPFSGFKKALQVGDIYLGIFGASLDTETIDDAIGNTFDAADESNWLTAYWTGRSVECGTLSFTPVKDDPIKEENLISSCDKFSELYGNISSAYKEYKACEDLVGDNSNKANVSSCKSKALSKVNSATDDLSTVCNRIMGSYDSTDACISSCLSATKSIATLKKNYLKPDDIDNDCGFSTKLLVWVNNIFKWIKYILPVIVIVFGIVDFIKAIADEKDDEMKKAQSRFIKRLIAAALAFIIPFIITFILEKMGFDANSCGLWGN